MSDEAAGGAAAQKEGEHGLDDPEQVGLGGGSADEAVGRAGSEERANALDDAPPDAAGPPAGLLGARFGDDGGEEIGWRSLFSGRLQGLFEAGQLAAAVCTMAKVPFDCATAAGVFDAIAIADQRLDVQVAQGAPPPNRKCTASAVPTPIVPSLPGGQRSF